MSSGGDKKETVVQQGQSGPPDWSVPYFQTAIQQAGKLASQPYQSYQGGRVAGFTGDQMNAMNMTRSLAKNPSGASKAAGNRLFDIINGNLKNPYSGQNPHLDQMVQSSQKDVTDAYSNAVLPNQLAQFNAGGAYGGTAHQAAMSQSQQDLAGALGDVSTTLRGQDYASQQQLAENDLDRRLGAIQYAPQFEQSRYMGADRLAGQGAVQQGWLQSVLDTDYGDYLDQRGWGGNQLGLLTNALGSIQGGTTSQSSTQANPNYRSAGQNAAGYAALLASLWG